MFLRMSVLKQIEPEIDSMTCNKSNLANFPALKELLDHSAK
jgi:hypothetical protein